MIRRLLDGLATRVRSFWDLDEPEERIEGSGEVHLDPAYNSRYTAERRLRALSNAQEAAQQDRQRDGPGRPGGRPP